jgi:hypothetical protein
MTKAHNTGATQIATELIELYQRNAPKIIRKQCRYIPSCSEYAKIAIEEYGVVIGGLISILRILRCIPPFGGYDPVPIRKEKDKNGSREMP